MPVLCLLPPQTHTCNSGGCHQVSRKITGVGGEPQEVSLNEPRLCGHCPTDNELPHCAGLKSGDNYRLSSPARRQAENVSWDRGICSIYRFFVESFFLFDKYAMSKVSLSGVFQFEKLNLLAHSFNNCLFINRLGREIAVHHCPKRSKRLQLDISFGLWFLP